MLQIFSRLQSWFIFNWSSYSGNNPVTCIYLLKDEKKIQSSNKTPYNVI